MGVQRVLQVSALMPEFLGLRGVLLLRLVWKPRGLLRVL